MYIVPLSDTSDSGGQTFGGWVVKPALGRNTRVGEDVASELLLVIFVGVDRFALDCASKFAMYELQVALDRADGEIAATTALFVAHKRLSV